VMTARPGRIKEVLEIPFGRPRDVEAVRADPRFAELRAHIWRQLHTARPGLAQPRAQTAARPAAGEVAP
jgi:NitT/TauT family transport system ATP-binding protein